MDDHGLVKTVDCLGQGVVIAIADAPDRWLDPGLCKALHILERDRLAAAVAVVEQATTMNRRQSKFFGCVSGIGSFSDRQLLARSIT